VVKWFLKQIEVNRHIMLLYSVYGIYVIFVRICKD